jgi:hypothetical protein
MDVRDIQDFLEWYWREIDGKPSRDSSLTIAEYYFDDKRKERNLRLYGMEEITKQLLDTDDNIFHNEFE